MASSKIPRKTHRPLPLMKRIAQSADALQKKVDWHTEIGESLLQMLNAHQGSALVAADFGLPDFNPEAVNVQSLRHYEQQMQRLINKYEPRFKEVEVLSRFDSEHKNRLIFHFRGVLAESYSLQKVSYYSVMTDHGRVLMRAAA